MTDFKRRPLRCTHSPQLGSRPNRRILYITSPPKKRHKKNRKLFKILIGTGPARRLTEDRSEIGRRLAEDRPQIERTSRPTGDGDDKDNTGSARHFPNIRGELPADFPTIHGRGPNEQPGHRTAPDKRRTVRPDGDDRAPTRRRSDRQPFENFERFDSRRRSNTAGGLHDIGPEDIGPPWSRSPTRPPGANRPKFPPTAPNTRRDRGEKKKRREEKTHTQPIGHDGQDGKKQITPEHSTERRKITRKEEPTTDSHDIPEAFPTNSRPIFQRMNEKSDRAAIEQMKRDRPQTSEQSSQHFQPTSNRLPTQTIKTVTPQNIAKQLDTTRAHRNTEKIGHSFTRTGPETPKTALRLPYGARHRTEPRRTQRTE